jgi:hypothetical protein
MAEWSNNGDPCTAILRLDTVHLFEPVERNLNHSFDIVNNCRSIEVSKVSLIASAMDEGALQLVDEVFVAGESAPFKSS